MHPTRLNVDYMRQVCREAVKYPVDSFEICGDCHSLLGGLDGLVLYDDYPSVAASIDRDGIIANQKKLGEILQLAHEIDKPVYYWHREVTVWPEMLKLMPDLLDNNGEFDLLGTAFAQLLEYKITHAFAALPELDGVVLTLTEADFSAIHNSNPYKYPPDLIVEHIVNIFARNCTKLGKRFILRSFGSIAKDYEDILAGAKLAAKKYAFEVETKITPYDFNPFLPENPFIYALDNLTLSAECDSLGEFLGAGYLPAENVENIVRYVRYAQKKRVNRFSIRIDRIGNNIFSSYPINLYAYMEAIRDKSLTAGQIRQDYADKFYVPQTKEELLRLGLQGYECVVKLCYIDKNLIFHQFPLQADYKWIKAGGIFGVFANNVKLNQLWGIWSIISSQDTPGRTKILQEKNEAKAIAMTGLIQVQKLRDKLPMDDYVRLERLWSNAVTATAAISAWIKCIACYFDDMEAKLAHPVTLHAAIDQLKAEIVPLLHDKNIGTATTTEFVNGMGHNVFHEVADNLDSVYLKPLLALSELLLVEYQAEFDSRAKYTNYPGVIDLIIPGAITDDWRCGRYMHASHALIKNGEPARYVGNQVFPNGFIEVKFVYAGELTIVGEGTGLLLTLNEEAPFEVKFDIKHEIVINISANALLKIQKCSSDYPLIKALILRNNN